MNKNTRQANHTKIIIDQIMWRMAAMDRFSDDDNVVDGTSLIPWDVITMTTSHGVQFFGVVHQVIGNDQFSWHIGFGANEHGIKQIISTADADNMNIRTIYETEGVQARQALTAIYTG